MSDEPRDWGEALDKIDINFTNWNGPLRRAAYRRGLEDAAKVAEAEGGVPEDTGSAPSDFVASGYNEACKDVAAAIRALMEDDS